MTVQLGRARIQLANSIIEIENIKATIQFGSVDFSAIVARASEAPTRRTHLPLEALTTRRIMNDGRVSVVTTNITPMSTELSAPKKYNVEASSSRGRPTRSQRRKMNAELRSQQQQLTVHPSNKPAQESEANVPTRNKFFDLKWVKRNSSTGELKKSFLEQRREVPAPLNKKEPETLSARVYRVLKIVKDKGLMKKFQRPLVIDTRRTLPRERLSFTAERRKRKQIPRGEYWGVTPELYIQGSTAEWSRWKGKQIWRPKPRINEKERREKTTDMGVTSVQLLMGNIDDKMQPFLCMATINTFQDLLNRVTKFEKLNLSRSENYSNKTKKAKSPGARRGEADSTFFSRADRERQDRPGRLEIVQADRHCRKYRHENSSGSRPGRSFLEEQWKTAVSKKTVKMLKQLEGFQAEKPLQYSLSPTRRGGVPNAVFTLLVTAENLLIFLPA
ncbi:hypothetical protein MA16_Dca008889 [Dendrobium catenatum]|uniref:Uncharacterized protein n=1 Tax=Dendrobium catenatum TaxID=906689 RepID=A0A2I0VUM4_9ASPA|nr:hypothetical protein MA16_Dca008889 [Dendrobium catenatum]